MLLIAFFDDFYRPNRLRGKSENTSRLYRLSVRSFGKTLGHPALLKELTNANVNRHMQRLIDDGRAKATANKDRSQLLALWRYAIKLGLLSEWPDVQPEIEPQRVPRAWMADEVVRLFRTIDRLPGKIDTCDRSLWWRCLLMLALDTGERIGALSECRWDWLEGRWLIIPAEFRKGKHRDRHYLLGCGTVSRLGELRNQSIGNKIFPWPYCSVYLWRKFGDILKEAGLPHGRRDKFHRLRRTCASVVHAAGLDATEALDHTHRRTTQAYLDPRFARKDQPSEILAQWLKNPPKNGRRKQA